MLKVKICGITNLEDALFASRAGADALGFVFYPKSPRYIAPIEAKEIIKKLPPFVKSVGLFVNVDSDFVNETVFYCGIDIAQIHFEASKEFYDKLKIPYIKVIRAKNKEDILKYSDEYRIVDAFVDSYGGEGKRVESSWFNEVDCSKIILAGGLNSKNLSDIKRFGFYGVDVSSGVEKKKGLKDHLKVKEFIEMAKTNAKKDI